MNISPMQWIVREATKPKSSVHPRNNDVDTVRSERDRLQILGVLVSESLTANDIASRVEMPVNRVVSLLGRLRADGLVNFNKANTKRPSYWFQEKKGN